MTSEPKRRWFQFSLKGLFVLLTVLACVSAMTSYFIQRWREHLHYSKAEKLNDLILRSEGYWEVGESVSLVNSRITKEQLTSLLKELRAFDNQTGLHLNRTAFDDSHVKEIVGHRHLQNLNLANTSITDEGLKELVALKSLEWVDLNYDAITDAGLQHLATLPKLKYIEVRGTKVTKEGIAKLKQSFPTLEVNQYSGD